MSVDFDQLRQSLRRAKRRLSRQPTQREIAATLRQRSRAVASRSVDGDERESLGQFVAVTRSDVRLAVSMTAVDAVRWVTVTVIPYANEVVNGVFQVRGRTQSVVDIAPLLSVPHSPLKHGEGTLVLLLDGSAGKVGVRVDEVVGSRAVAVDEVDWGFADRTTELVSHVLLDRTMILDVEALLSNPAIRLQRRQ